MWRIISIITGVVSFIAILFYWEKRQQVIEDDQYYLYGDSLYQGASEEKVIHTPSPKDHIKSQYTSDIESDDEISSMIH